MASLRMHYLTVISLSITLFALSDVLCDVHTDGYDPGK